MAKYKKAERYRGKHLSVMVGRGDLTLRDGVIYNDGRLARYVNLGWVEVVEDDKKAEAKAPKKTETPKESPEAKSEDQGVSSEEAKSEDQGASSEEAKSGDQSPASASDEGSTTRSPAARVKPPAGGRRRRKE